MILIALLPDDGSSTSFDRSSINETFKKPFDAALLAERLRTLDRREERARLTPTVTAPASPAGAAA